MSISTLDFPLLQCFNFFGRYHLFSVFHFCISGQWEPFSAVCSMLLIQPQWVCSFSPVHCLASVFFSDPERFLSGFWAQVCLFVYILSLLFFVFNGVEWWITVPAWVRTLKTSWNDHPFVRYLKEISWNSVHDDVEQKFYDYKTYTARWKVQKGSGWRCVVLTTGWKEEQDVRTPSLLGTFSTRSALAQCWSFLF